MAYPVILVNNSTGSDTNTSGAGPATAIYGAAAAHTNGSASTTITLTNNPDLSGVATDGSHALYIASGARTWSKITGVDNVNKTVTVEESFTIAAASAKNYAIGGKRATLQDATFRTFALNYIKPGWTIEIEYTGSDYTMTNTLQLNIAGDTTDGRITLKGSGATRPTITSSTNSLTIFTITANYITAKDIIVTHTAATRGYCISPTGRYGIVSGCKLDGGSYGIYASNDLDCWDCEILNSTTGGLCQSNSNTYMTAVKGCWIHDNTGPGLKHSHGSLAVSRCVIANNTTYGIQINTAANAANRVVVMNNTIAGNGSDGILFTDKATDGILYIVFDNIIYDNVGYGVNFGSTAAEATAEERMNCNNAFGANDGGDRNTFPAGLNDVSLSGDPFTNAGSDDYSLNATAGAGGACRDAGWPASFPDPSRSAYMDIGAMESGA